MKIKKMISPLLAVVIVLSCLCLSVSADEAAEHSRIVPSSTGDVVEYSVESDDGYYCMSLEFNTSDADSETYTNFDGLKVTATSALIGDANLDDNVNLIDAVYILKYIAGYADVHYEAYMRELTLDFNFSGSVNLSDVIGILKYIANWDNCLPTETDSKRMYDVIVPLDITDAAEFETDIQAWQATADSNCVVRSADELATYAGDTFGYDAAFFEEHDILICYNPAGSKTTLSELRYSRKYKMLFQEYTDTDEREKQTVLLVSVDKSLEAQVIFPI